MGSEVWSGQMCLPCEPSECFCLRRWNVALEEGDYMAQDLQLPADGAE